MNTLQSKFHFPYYNYFSVQLELHQITFYNNKSDVQGSAEISGC